MFEKFFYVIDSICSQNFTAFNSPSMLMAVYVCVGVAIFIDSGFLPAAPMPCDSVVILSGTLGAMGVVNFHVMLAVLVLGGVIGSYAAYLQGHYLTKLTIVKKWMGLIPIETMQKVDDIIFKKGLLSLFVAKFIPIIRPLTPLVIGLRAKSGGISSTIGIQLVISSIIWIVVLMGLGASITLLPENLKHVALSIIIVSPIVTACVGVVGAIIKYLHNKFKK